MKREHYVVIPQCTDLNRGDQALVWETIRIAQEAGLAGTYHIMSDSVEDTHQTMNLGFNVCGPILKHPSRFFKESDNIVYGLSMKLKWGFVALVDLMVSILILIHPTRKIVKRLVTKEVRHTITLFEASDAVLVKGGGFIHGYGGFVSTYYIYYMLFHIFLAHKLKKKVFMMPNSLGPFKGPWVKKMVYKALSHCEYAVVRESISKDKVKEAIDLELPVMHDLGFFLDADVYKPLMYQYLKDLNVPLGEKKCIGITMRPYRFPGSDDPAKAYADYKQAFIDFVDDLGEKGYHIVFVEHTLSRNAHENDGKSIQDILPYLKNASTFTFVSDTTLNSRHLKGMYSHLDAMVGTRFHSVIFAMSEGVPALAITYGGNKGDGIMKDMGLSDFAIPIGTIDANTLKHAFQNLMKQKESVGLKIKAYLDTSNILREYLIEDIARKHGDRAS